MTIYDIAKMSGVSPSTVSRVLNNNGYVSSENRNKIEAVISRENYRPNAFAHYLTKKESKTIGIICPEISDGNHARLVEELSRLLRAKGFEIYLISVNRNNESKRPYFESMIQRYVDAIIVIGCNRTEGEKKDFKHVSSRVPLFVLGGHMDLPGVHCVLCDECDAIRDAVRYLTEMNRKHILFVYDTETFSGTMKLRGYMEGLKLYASSQPYLLRIGEIHENIVMTSRESTLSYPHAKEIDAVIAADDTLAVGTMKALQDLHLPPVPVIGFNNTSTAYCATPEISSIDTHVIQQCELLVQTLFSSLKKEETSACIRLKALMIERESTTRFR